MMVAATRPPVTGKSASLARLQVGTGRPCSAGLDLAIFLISPRSDKVNLFGRPPEYYRNQVVTPRSIGDIESAGSRCSASQRARHGQ
jgi:hypothetical protein